MSFKSAMDVVSVDPASASMSAAQIKAALVGKYGTSEGGVISTQFGQVATDSANNCSGSTTSSTAAAAPAATPDPAATSESSCSVDCTNPVPSGESGWLAQVSGALQNVQQDLTTLSSDASNDPDNVIVDGSQLETDAQAALDPNYDPPPADNADWVTAMNDYVTAGQDYAGDNVNQQDDNAAQANQELQEAYAALAKFNAANGGVLNGIIQSLSPVLDCSAEGRADLGSEHLGREPGPPVLIPDVVQRAHGLVATGVGGFELLRGAVTLGAHPGAEGSALRPRWRALPAC
jgi:hypothetical protein